MISEFGLQAAARLNVFEIDLSGQFTEFWGTLTKGSGLGPILKLASFFGIAIIVFAIIKWAWDRRRGGGMGGGNSGAVWGALLVGSLLSAPDLLIPILLAFLDVVVNAAVNIFSDASKESGGGGTGGGPGGGANPNGS